MRLHMFKIKILLQRSSASTQGLSLNAILVQRTTAYINYEEITPSFKKMPHHFTQCVQHSFEKILYAFRYDSFKVQLHLLKLFIAEQYYMFSKEYPTITPKVSLFCLSGKLCGKNKNFGGMAHCSGTQWLKTNFFNPASLDSKFTNCFLDLES